MKKTYIQPNIKSAEVRLDTLICASEVGLSNDILEEEDVQLSRDDNSTGTINLWDKEW